MTTPILIKVMRARVGIITLFVACATALPSLPSLRPRGSSLVASAAAQKNFGADASSLLNNVRTPAALVAGATFGAIFALQPSATDSMAIGVAKRFHLLIGVGALSAELIAVLVSSITLTRLGMEGKTSAADGSVMDFLYEHYELELLATELNFQLGLLGLCTMVGIRAWVTFSCPRFAKIAAGFIAAAVLTMLSFMSERQHVKDASLIGMAARYIFLLCEKAWVEKRVLLFLGLGMGVYSVLETGKAAFIMASTPWAKLVGLK